MSGVKRYKLGGNISPVATIFLPEVVVDASDYDHLAQGCERLREELHTLNDEIIDHRNYTKACRERDEAAIKQVDGLRELLIECRDFTDTLQWPRMLRDKIDAALQAKP